MSSIIYITIIDIERDKSFVDDLDMERGIVSVRVTFVLRSTEIQPIVMVICHETKNNLYIILGKKKYLHLFYRTHSPN